MTKRNEDKFCFLFFPGDYLRDTQNLSPATQVAYDRIMCEHMRNICISQQQLNFFTKRLNVDEKEEMSVVLAGNATDGFYIPWVRREITKRLNYSQSRSKNRQGKPPKKDQEHMLTYVQHMEIEKEEEKEEVIERGKRERKVFAPPTIVEVENFFAENDFAKELGAKAWKYYHEADWTDSKGNKVKNWKQKMRGVWFREENRNYGSSHQQTGSQQSGSHKVGTVYDPNKVGADIRRLFPAKQQGADAGSGG